MDAINKIIHPKQNLHADDDNDFAATRTPPPSRARRDEEAEAGMRPNQETMDRLGDEPNVTGTDRPAPADEFSSNLHQPQHQHQQQQQQQQQQQGAKISRGHHHPRQPVGATGLPPNHKPPGTTRQGGGGGGVTGQGARAGGVEGAGGGATDDDLVGARKVVAESSNNFPGTNPHPAHSALGNQSMTGERGTIHPGRE